jgi:hypothetical protein
VIDLNFTLEVDDGWPPFAGECIPCTHVMGGYRIEAPPLFIKDISVGDVIAVNQDNTGNVTSWKHVHRSARTTIWLLRLNESDAIERVLSNLRSIHCNTASLPELGVFSIDIPQDVAIDSVDHFLADLDQASVAVAYPSIRHKDKAQLGRNLQAYGYFATRMALMSSAPSLVYWLTSGFWMAVKAFLAFNIVVQPVATWIFRRQLIEAIRDKWMTRKIKGG